MSDYTVKSIGTSGSVVPSMTPTAFHCDLAGLQIVAIPPGEIEVRKARIAPTINVAPERPGANNSIFRLNNKDVRARATTIAGGAIDIFAGGGELDLVCSNYAWECLLEFNEDRIGQVAAEAWSGDVRLTADFASRADPVAVQLARLAIEHLRFGPVDRLYVEGLAVALTARGIGFAIGREATVSTAGTDARIARAIDFIEAHLADDLSLAAIASAACMSPSWLKTSFRAQIGKPVWAYVKERRLERARLLLTDRNLSLAQIAYESGFSSHSHMSRAFKQQFGTAPSNMRWGIPSG